MLDKNTFKRFGKFNSGHLPIYQKFQHYSRITFLFKTKYMENILPNLIAKNPNSNRE